MTFGVWLKKQSETDEDAARLQRFAEDNIRVWPFHSDDLPDYLDALATPADETERRALLQILGRKFQQWLRQENPGARGWWPALLAAIQANAGAVLLTLFGLAIAVILVAGIFNDAFLASLARPENARGLITFLFAFSTIAMFILIAIATFWMDRQEVEMRFGYAKDLLTVVIGILGTIIGFYFGSLAG